MQAKRRVYATPVTAATVANDAPSKYWGLVLVAACMSGWVAVIAAAKPFIALI
jgi:hypothetical protein